MITYYTHTHINVRDLFTTHKHVDANPYPSRRVPYTSWKTIHVSKETYVTQKRPTSIKRDLRQSKETYVNQKRPTSIKRVLSQSKETYTRQKRLMNIKDKDALFTSRDLLTTNKHKKMRICVLLEGCQINPGR